MNKYNTPTFTKGADYIRNNRCSTPSTEDAQDLLCKELEESGHKYDADMLSGYFQRICLAKARIFYQHLSKFICNIFVLQLPCGY